MLIKKYFIYAPGNPPYELKHNDVSSTKIGFPFAFEFNAYFNLSFTISSGYPCNSGKSIFTCLISISGNSFLNI